MNPPTLDRYLSQCYNIGNPSPDPTRRLSDQFPKLQPARKRSLRDAGIEDSSLQSPKVAKMMSDQDWEKLWTGMDKKMANLVTKDDLDNRMREVVKEEVGKVKTDLDLEKGEREALGRAVEGLQQEVAELKKGVPSVDKEALKEELLPALRSEISGQITLQWRMFLIEEIKQHLPGLMMYGIGLKRASKTESIDSFKDFCKNTLKMSTESVAKLNVCDIRFMSAAGSSKPTILVKLGSPQERNDVLRNSWQLQNGQSLDKYVPKRYLTVYKRLKNTAWKLRKLHNQSTSIDFNGHLLTLKHKNKDVDGKKYSWTIFSEWAPEPTDSIIPQTTRTSTAEGLTPTPPLKLGTDDTMVITGLKAGEEVTDDGIKSNFLKLLDKDGEKVDSIRIVGSMIVVRCKSKHLCTELKRDHCNKTFMNCTLKWALESEA